MKQRYIFFLFSVLFLAGCSKDFLKPYEDRIDGDWELVDIDRRGFGGSSPLPVRTGDRFSFAEDGTMIYRPQTGQQFEGTWDIRREWTQGQCNYDEFGNYVCDNRRVKTLYLVGVDFGTQDFFSIQFDEMQFTGTNRFKAFIYDGWRTYVFRFRR
jgi:hypothetical protein